MHFVVIGNGVAGMEAAIVVRNREPDARITIISAEHDHFYSRTALMYLMCGQLSLRDTEPYDRELYTRMRFERVRKRVTKVEPDHVVFDDGSTLAFDRLLLAMGSRARPAPWPGAGPDVHTFVTLQDMERLDADATPGKTVCVIGGGLIGVEVAEVLKLRGLKVHFLIREPWYFPVALDEAEATFVASHIRSHGVDVRLGANVDAIERNDGRIVGVRLGGELLSCDLVVAAIGVVPNTDPCTALPTSAGAVETEPNLSVRGFPAIFAAGDCANVTWIDGSRRPEQLWYTARDQGRVAGRAMLGDDVTYRRSHWYNSAKFFDLEYTTAGFVPPDATGYTTWYQQLGDTTQRIVCKGDRAIGFNALGSRWNHAVFNRWFGERRSLAYVLDHIGEARFDEELSPVFKVTHREVR
jgi:NADPH-dependent 2,4-dienoyl-CoA reductase/sulfur reductase-like enzyme